jgi:hypothetical protein
MVDTPRTSDRYDRAFGDASSSCMNGTSSHDPNRPDAYTALASALVDAGLEEPFGRNLARGRSIDLALLEAITRRPGLPGSISRLIRDYLGSLSQITSSLVPGSVLVNGTTEISTWRYDFGRLAGAGAERSGPIQPA